MKVVLLALVIVGATGVADGETMTAEEATLAPTALFALTVQEYDAALVIAVTVIGEVVALAARVLPALTQVAV